MLKSLETELERAELEAMVERLARSPRLSNLLRYIGEKYLRGETEQLREFNIATEVFGRPGTFDPSEDAIARVEAHRLRKKLTEFYESEGKDRPVRISIPPGGYIPVFKHRAEQVETHAPTAEPDAVEEPVSLTAPVVAPSRFWMYALGVLALVVSVVAAVAIRSRGSASALAGRSPSAARPAPVPVLAAGLANAGGVRFLAGYSGQPHMDPSGLVWGADRYFERGGPWRGSQQFTARTNDPFLFQAVRTGEFAYQIPLKAGVYELHLYFVEPSYGPGLGGGELSRTFNVGLNESPLLPGFDIEDDAMGANIADERIFKDVQPESDGKLHLNFEGVSGKPIVSAIEVVPAAPHLQNPIRLTTQPYVYIDHSGQVWSPDNYFLNGQTSLRKPPVTGSPDPGLFSTERFGHFNYAIPVDVRSRYTAVLYFSEFYFGPQAPGKGGVGSRVFNVTCNGISLLEDFDIFKEAGSLHALVKTFRHLKPNAQGKLNLSFDPIANYANVSAIEVLDESQ